jgi:hypothetical protein
LVGLQEIIPQHFFLILLEARFLNLFLHLD